MNRKVVYLLIVLALSAVVLIANSRGMGTRVSVNLLVTQISGLKSLVFLCFMGVGVIIGALLK